MTFSKSFLLTLGLIFAIVGLIFGQRITQSTYLPLWKVGQSWTYRNFSMLPMHKWMNLKESDIKDVRYTVMEAHPFGLAYEYILFTEYLMKDGTIIPDFQYAPVSNLNILPIPGLSSSYLDFPLYIGKKWKLMIPNSNPISCQECPKESEGWKRVFPILVNVQATETVVTPAGTFTSYKISYRQNDGITFNLWYSPKVENIVKGQQASSVLVKYSTIPKDKLKDYMLKVVEKMPKNLSDQKSYVVLSLYQFGILNSNEALKLIYGSQN